MFSTLCVGTLHVAVIACDMLNFGTGPLVGQSVLTVQFPSLLQKTALHMAKTEHHKQTEQCLVELGADDSIKAVSGDY